MNKFNLEVWHWWRDRKETVIFFGMYHILDVIRFVWHRGPRHVFWAGSDIRNLNWLYALLVRDAKHTCENEVEQLALKKFGIQANIHPMFFDDYKHFRINFKRPESVAHVYLTCHSGRHKEYGVDLIESIAYKTPNIIYHIYGIRRPYHEIWHDSITGEVHNLNYYCPDNIIYHGKVGNKQFNREIQEYHAALRMNEFDGFSEILGKSLLMGQYPISRIQYPMITQFLDEQGLILCLEKLLKQTEPNYSGREYWLKKLSTSTYPL